MKYINISKVKQFCKTKNRRVGADFTFALNAFIQDRLNKACEIKNGGKITLDGDVARFIGFKV